VNFIARLLGARTDRPLVVGPSAIVVGPAADGVATPLPRFIWDERKWTRIVEEGAVSYMGHYRVFVDAERSWRSFDGRIVEANSEIRAYIADPPATIKTHQKGRCFQFIGGPWFLLHWHRRPENIDAALLYVERILDECLNGRRGRQR